MMVSRLVGIILIQSTSPHLGKKKGTYELSIFKGHGSMLHLAVPWTALYHYASWITVGVLDLGIGKVTKPFPNL